MVDPESTKKFWDDAAKKTTLDDSTSVGMLTDGNEFNAHYRRVEEEAHFLRIFQPEKSMSIMEVGSGGGRWSFFLSDKVFKIVGIDFSSQMVALAEKLQIKNGINNIRFIETDLLSYDDDNKYDLIYFSGILQYLNDDDLLKSVKKATRMLTPTGVIISRDTVQELERLVLDGEYPVVYRTVDEYRKLFTQSGYKMTYCDHSYNQRRFSQFVSRIYNLPFVSFKMAYGFQSILVAINNILGNPRFLMKKHYKDMLDSVGKREHRFFRYDIDNK